MFCDRLHEKWRDAVSNPRPPIAVASHELKLFGIGCQHLNLGNGQFPDFIGMDPDPGRSGDAILVYGRYRSPLNQDE
jgi:hypothetical protein